MYELMKLRVYSGSIVKRPSAQIKTPYVADVATDSESVLAHAISLGCDGLCEKGANVWMTKTDSGKTAYSICLSELSDGSIVGIHSKLAEKMAEKMLRGHRLIGVIRKWRRETVVKCADPHLDSRFDFSGVDYNGVPFLMEVKNVPLKNAAGYAHFPKGWRKKNEDPVSPRALKHITELTELKRRCGKRIRCIMCYIIQRTDVEGFTPSDFDPEYCAAYYAAETAGVEMLPVYIHWSIQDMYATATRASEPKGSVFI